MTSQADKLKIKPYWKPRDTISSVVFDHSQREDLPDSQQKLSVGGRIIGRRKASSSLLFVDLESNGKTIQVMLDGKNMPNHEMRQVAQTCQRGAIIGVDGYPGRTQAGEFSIVAEDVAHLASCDVNLPMMNWNHKKTLKDKEVRFQKRYLDLIVNSELK